MLYSCKTPVAAEAGSNRDMITMQGENLTMIESKEGKRAYRFKTPLLESHEMAREPFMEFRKGIFLETFNDSTQLIETTLTANYAINYKEQGLWMAAGSVEVVNSKNEKLETEQLYWDEKAGRIFSNVDVKMSSPDGVNYGTGFESDDKMDIWKIKNPNWSYTVPEDMSLKDSTKQAVPPARAETGKETYPVIREGEAVAKPAER